MKFSRRIPTDWSPSPWSTLAKAPLDLTLSSPQGAGIGWPAEELRQRMVHSKEWLCWSPSARGSLQVREALVRYEARRGFSCVPQDFFLTASTSEGYSTILRLLCDPGDSILVPKPGYPLLDVLGGLENLQVISYGLNLQEGEWRLDVESLPQGKGRLRALVAVNPNNPTGSTFTVSEWNRIVDFCEKVGCALIVDEVFSDICLGSIEQAPWHAYAQRIAVFRLHGLSKCVGLPQLKLSWIWRGVPQVDQEQVDQGLEYILDAFLNLSALPESLAADLLEVQPSFQSRVLERVLGNAQLVQDILGGYASELPAVQGGWYQCVRWDGIDDEAFCLRLAQEEGVLVQPGYFFDFAQDGWLVLSLLPTMPMLREGLERMRALHKRW